MPIQRPAPIHPPVQRVSEPSHLTLSAGVPVEIGGGGQGAGDQDGGVDGRQLGTPCTPAARDIEEMVEEALVAGRIAHWSVRSVPEEAQRGQRTLHRLCAGHERALDRDGITGERQSHAGDAGGDAVG